MLGHYCDTPETMHETVQFMKTSVQLNPHVVLAVSYNTPFPGTWQYTHADKVGLKIKSSNYTDYDLNTPFIEGKAFTTDDLIAAYKEAEPLVYQTHLVKSDF